MSDNETKDGRPLRSARWFRKDDLPGFVHRSTLSTAGWSREDLMERPVVGILNTWSDINPCNLNLRTLAEEHGYIVVSPLGFSPLGAYGNPLRLPAVFGESATAAAQRAAVTPERRRELALSELEVITALELVTEEYGADRSRTFLAGHSMGSGGAWHLAARYPERWRAVAPMSGPFVDEATYPFDRIKKLPMFMTEGTGATPSLEGSRALARYLRERGFVFEYLEVDGNHGSMVPMVWPRIFEFFEATDKKGTHR